MKTIAKTLFSIFWITSIFCFASETPEIPEELAAQSADKPSESLEELEKELALFKEKTRDLEKRIEAANDILIQKMDLADQFEEAAIKAKKRYAELTPFLRDVKKAIMEARGKDCFDPEDFQIKIIESLKDRASTIRTWIEESNDAGEIDCFNFKIESPRKVIPWVEQNEMVLAWINKKFGPRAKLRVGCHERWFSDSLVDSVSLRYKVSLTWDAK